MYYNKLDFDLKDLDLKTLKDVYNDLCRTVDKLYTVTAGMGTENDDLFLKLNKIINTVLQAKYELADDVLEPFGRQNDL